MSLKVSSFVYLMLEVNICRYTTCLFLPEIPTNTSLGLEMYIWKTNEQTNEQRKKTTTTHYTKRYTVEQAERQHLYHNYEIVLYVCI